MIAYYVMDIFRAVHNFDLLETDLLASLLFCICVVVLCGAVFPKGSDFHRFHSDNISRIYDAIVVNRAMCNDTIGYREFLTEQRENLGATWPLYAAAGSAHPIRVDSHEAVVALVFEDDHD